MNIENLIRDNIKAMKPYSSARHDFNGKGSVYLDANENPFGVFNRYPDPLQIKLKQRISELRLVPVGNIFIGNGSDEAIDLLFRIFCRPGNDTVLIFPPTYGMYEVCANINEIKVKKIPLLSDYQLDLGELKKEIGEAAKLLFLCSPNNPTGNSINQNDIEWILNTFGGIVVIDEAYVDFATQKSLLSQLSRYPNLVILQTLSKAYGLAGLRLGLAFGSKTIINYMNKIKYPYNINSASQQLALDALENNYMHLIIEQREWLKNELSKFSFIETIYPSDANFLFIKVQDPAAIYDYLRSKGIIVRYKEGIRITVGTPEENKILIKTLKTYE